MRIFPTTVKQNPKMSRYISTVKPGTYIRQYILRYKGVPLYRHGIVPRMVTDRPPTAEVLLFPHEQPNHPPSVASLLRRNYYKYGLYTETIKLEIIEILAEPRTT